ncbi:hypothetical protein ACUXST_000138 [Sphingomonas sp. F9_3S_D5_B_2]
MQPERVADLRHPPVVGRTYLVPVVNYRLVQAPYFHDRDWPVIRPRHNDAALGFDVYHLHIDARFLSPDQDLLARQLGSAALRCRPELYLADADWLGGFAGDVQFVEAPWFPPLPKPEVRERVCIRSDFAPAVDLTPSRFAPIQKHETISRVNGKLICPHMKADISSYPVRDGSVRCPLHGLRLRVAGEEGHA